MRRALTACVPLLCLAGVVACSGSDDTATTGTTAAASAGSGTGTTTAPADAGAGPTTTVQGTGQSPADTGTPGTGAYVPTTARSVDAQTLPPAVRPAAEFAAGDEQERNCINATIADALGDNPEQASRNDVVAGLTGTAIVECLAPSKLGASTTERLRASVLGPKLTEDQISCIRSMLTGGDPLSYTVFIGGIVVNDEAIMRQGATGIDTACGTNLAAG